MNIELLEKKETPLLSRTRVQYKVTYENVTPSRESVKEAVAADQRVGSNLTVIRHVYPKFGKREAKVIAHIYASEADARAIEDVTALKKHFKEPKSEKAESAGEEKQEEKTVQKA